MKHKFKNYLKLGILLFGISMAIISCEKDETIETNSTNETTKKYKLTHKSFSDLLNDKRIAGFIKSYPRKTEIKNRISNNLNLNNRTVQSEENDFYIDTDKSIYIENTDSYHKSYTFSVVRTETDDNYVENLVLSFPKEGVYQLTLVKYELTSQEKQAIKDGIAVDLSNNSVTITPIQDTIFDSSLSEKLEVIQDGDCYSLILTECQYGNSSHPDGLDNGVQCPGYHEDTLWEFCNGEGGGSGGTEIDSDDSSGVSGISGTSSSNNNGGTANVGNDNVGVNNDNIDNELIDSSCRGCGWTAPIVVFPELELEEDPCDDLKKLLDPQEANIAPALMDLKSTLGQEGENGYEFENNTNNGYSNTQLPASTTAALPIDTSGGDIYAAAHTHPKDAYPMFSFHDFIIALQLYNNSNSQNQSESTFMLVTSPGSVSTPATGVVYAIKINDISTYSTALSAVVNNIIDPNDATRPNPTLKQKIDAVEDKLQDKYHANTNNEQAVLKFMQSFGASLYKANTALDNWSELTLEESAFGTVIETPCN